MADKSVSSVEIANRIGRRALERIVDLDAIIDTYSVAASPDPATVKADASLMRITLGFGEVQDELWGSPWRRDTSGEWEWGRARDLIVGDFLRGNGADTEDLLISETWGSYKSEQKLQLAKALRNVAIDFACSLGQVVEVEGFEVWNRDVVNLLVAEVAKTRDGLGAAV